MSSINLLPEAFSSKYREKNVKKISPFISFLMLAIVIVIYAYLYANDHNSSQKVMALSFNIANIEKQIEEEVTNNKLLSVEVKGRSAELILANHSYFTKVTKLIQENLIDEAYLNSLDILNNDKKLIFNFKGISKDYSVGANQLSVFKSSPLIKSVQIEEISVNEMGLLEFSCSLNLEEKVLLYKNEEQF